MMMMKSYICGVITVFRNLLPLSLSLICIMEQAPLLSELPSPIEITAAAPCLTRPKLPGQQFCL